MFYNGFQEVSSPRMNPSPKRERSSWLSLGRQRQAATNQVFQEASVSQHQDPFYGTRAQSLLPMPEGAQSHRADLDPPQAKKHCSFFPP